MVKKTCPHRGARFPQVVAHAGYGRTGIKAAGSKVSKLNYFLIFFFLRRFKKRKATKQKTSAERLRVKGEQAFEPALMLFAVIYEKCNRFRKK